MSSKEELQVMFILQDVSQLLSAVQADPLKFEDHLSEIQDIRNHARDAATAILNAMAGDSNLKALCINASNKSSEMALVARLK